jgi:uncharacterized protein (UPF0276 family)
MTPTAGVTDRLGVGLGYRVEFGHDVGALLAATDCVELTVEQYVGTTPERREHIVDLCRGLAVTTHSLELSVGTLEDWDDDYARQVVAFATDVGAKWFSDHLCFTRCGPIAIGALAPLARDRATATMVGERAARLQDAAGIPFLLENITSHLDLGGEMNEPQFITEVVEAGGCGLLLDLANLSINARNHRFDPYAYLDEFPLERVVEVHVAGGTIDEGIAYDTHSRETPAEVWDLLEVVARRADIAAVIIERDQDVPTSVAVFQPEIDAARRIIAGGRSA